MNDFVPVNEFEGLLERSQAGVAPVGALMMALLEAQLVIPSFNEVQDNWAGFEPLLFDKNGVQMLACFSDRARIQEAGQVVRGAPYCLEIYGRGLLRRMPRGYGIVINPGLRTGFDITPEGIAKLLRDTGA